MLNCLKTRLGVIHIINWTTYRGIHYTLCQKSFSSKTHVETFAADNIFPGMCPICYEIQEMDNQSVVDYDLRDVRHDHVLESSLSDYRGVQKGWGGISSKFDDLTVRYWHKAAKMRRKFPTEEVKPKKPKKRKKYKLTKSHGKFTAPKSAKRK